MVAGRVVIALVFLGSLVFPQQPPAPLLKTEVSDVVVDAIVTDRKGHHVRGLTAGDFRIYEDGELQKITSFTASSTFQGAATTLESPSPPGSPSPLPGSPPAFLTLVLDMGDLHPDSVARACAAASRFLAKPHAAGTQFAVYWVDTSLHLASVFSADKRTAIEALDRLRHHIPSGRLTVTERKSIESEIGRGSSIADPVVSPHVANMMRTWLVTLNALQANTVFVSLRAIALAYRDLPGRKNVVLFSEGFPHAHDGGAAIQGVVDAANRGNVSFYFVDAGGLAGEGAGNQNNAISKEKPDVVAGGMDQFDWIETIGTEVHGDLGVIADYTGGFWVRDSNDLDGALDRIAGDADEFYTLVYTPPQHEFDGSFRKIKVELAVKGLRVRHRRGYWAMPPGRDILMTPAAAQLLAYVQSGERKPSFVPQVNAVVVPDPSGGFSISAAVALPGKLMRFAKAGDRYVASLNVLLLAQDANGKILSVREHYGDVQLDQKGRRDFAAGVFNWQGHVSLPELQPVQVRALVRLADGSFGASGVYDVPIPAASAGLRLTPLVLSQRGDAQPCQSVDPDPLCVQGMRMMLPAQPSFTRSNSLLVYFSVMGLGLNSGNQPNLGISFRIRSSATDTAFPPKNFVTVKEPQPRSLGILAEFDIGSISPGTYMLQAMARDKILSAQATRDAGLTVQ